MGEVGTVKGMDCWVTLERYKIGYSTGKAKAWELGLRKAYKNNSNFILVNNIPTNWGSC